MNIGIAAPVEISSLQNHLTNLTENELKLGLGGTAINILIDGFIKAGHKVTVFTLDPIIKDKYILEGPYLKVILGHFRASSKWKWVDFCRKEFLQIKRFIKEEEHNVDIINAHWSYEFAIGAMLSKPPHLITFRDHSQTILKMTWHPYRLTRLIMDMWVRKKGKRFSFNSLYLKSLIKKEGLVIPNPIRESEIGSSRKFPIKKGKIKICFIANGWGYGKNPECAIEAFYLLQKQIQNVELHLIGHGYIEKGKKYDFVCKNKRDKNVRFRGGMKHNELLKELNQFDLLLHTSREESFGNNLIEAMAKGIPVVAGKLSGAVPWVLDNGFAGCLTNVESPEEIARDLQRLLTDADYYEELSKNGIKNLHNRFIQEKVCALYIEEFKRILNISENYK